MRINIGIFKISSALLIFLSSFASTSLMADTYGIQVGAFKNVPAGLIGKLEDYAAVTTLQGKAVTSIIVGNYTTVSAAEMTLFELQNAGFSSAFIRDIDKARTQVQSSGQTRSSVVNSHDKSSGNGYEHPLFNAAEQAKWKTLSPSQQRNAVLLDGKLHLKQGDKFVPIGVSAK